MGAIDVIGDIHGQLGALRRLGAYLGYDVDGDWRHDQDRHLVFVGDLIDRGPHSLEVAELVHRLCIEGKAVCLLGNHEYNLVEWHRGRSKPKSSNRSTIDDVRRRPARWAPVLEFFESLPIAVELDDLRITHAVWHRAAFDVLAPLLATSLDKSVRRPAWAPAVALYSPYDDGDFRPGIGAASIAGQDASPLEIFLKGYETKVQVPFQDNDGALRYEIRAMWWQQGHDDVVRDRRVIFGHYWNLPPIPGRHDAFVPPFPSGHPDLRAWFDTHHEAVGPDGRVAVPPQVQAVCVDFNGVTRAGARACVGAYRHPDAEVLWASVG